MSSDAFREQEHDRHSAIVIQFHPTFLGEGFFSAPELRSIDDLLFKAGRGLKFEGESQNKIGGKMKTMVPQNGIERLQTLLHCLVAMASAADDPDEHRVLASVSWSTAEKGTRQDRLHQVFEFIDKRLFDPDLTQSAIAQSVGMNPSALSRFFKAATQRTITDYICELRVGHAARLLLESDESVLNICNRVGFENPTSFARRFRAFRGFSPSEFRKRFKQLE